MIIFTKISNCIKSKLKRIEDPTNNKVQFFNNKVMYKEIMLFGDI